MTHSFPTRRSSDLRGLNAKTALPSEPEKSTRQRIKAINGQAVRRKAAQARPFALDRFHIPIDHLLETCDRLRHRPFLGCGITRSEEHTSELQSLMRTSYAVFCLKKKKNKHTKNKPTQKTQTQTI